MKLEDFLIKAEGDDSRHLPDGRYASTWDSLGRVWNIGTGITVGVTRDTVWTKAQLDAAEAKELADVEACVSRLVKVPLTENQRVACESLAYNVGDAGFEHSSVLRELNAGRYALACQDFAHWNKCHGEVEPGHVNRRRAEMALFNHPDDAPVPSDLRAVKTAITATSEAIHMDQRPAPVPAVTVPVSTLKTAANVSQTQLKVTSALAIFGSIFGIIGPMLAVFFPSQAHTVAAAATFVSGFGVTATAIVHQLNLGASAEATTNAYIDSVSGTASAISDSLGGPVALAPKAA